MDPVPKIYPESLLDLDLNTIKKNDGFVINDFYATDDMGFFRHTF